MRVFCPNCGTQNEAPDAFPPGVTPRVTCSACTATFEVQGAQGAAQAPGASSMVPPVPQGAVLPPPPGYRPPASQGYAPGTTGSAGSGWLGAPAPQGGLGTLGQPQGVSTFGQPAGAAKNNSLAVVSLVAAVLVCIPFSSIIAIVTGVLALSQINASGGQQGGKGLAIAGVAIGGTFTALGILGALFSFLVRA